MQARRIALAVALTTVLSAPLAAEAQPVKVRAVVGVLASGTLSIGSTLHAAFEQRLRELGYTVGQDVILEYRYAEGMLDRLPGLAQDLVRLNPAVIVVATGPGIQAVSQATRTIPIVMPVSGDVVGIGLVASLARPGGNITGLTQLSAELSSKRLQLLQEIVPNVRRAAVLWNAANPEAKVAYKETEAAAQALGIQVQSVEVRAPADFPEAFRAAIRGTPGALMVLIDPMVLSYRHQVIAFAAEHRLPAMYPWAEAVIAGGLVSYGPNLASMWRRAADYVDKILKGAKPADLPVEQPTELELLINMKTAKVLGLTIPQSLLLRADHVIE